MPTPPPTAYYNSIDLNGNQILGLGAGLFPTDVPTFGQVRRDLATWTSSGNLTVFDGTIPFPVYGSFIIVGVIAAVGTAPTGRPIIVDVLKNGVTIFTTTANRPTILAGNTTTLALAAPDITSLVLNDLLTFSILQIGSTIAGSDLCCLIVADRVS